MQKYKVLKYFQWGDLTLDKGQIILVEKQNSDHSLVSLEHYPNKSQLVGTSSIEGMTLLKKIEKY